MALFDEIARGAGLAGMLVLVLIYLRSEYARTSRRPDDPDDDTHVW